MNKNCIYQICVPIPQGVRNWRPPGKCASGRTGDSSEVPKSNVSSVFKGVPVPADDGDRPHAGKTRHDCRTEVSSVGTSDDRRTSRSNLITQLDCSEESSVKGARTKDPESTGKVAYYRDPAVEAATATLGERMRNKLLARRTRVRKSGRKALVVSVPVLAIIAVFTCKHGCHTAPQETEASAKSPPPLVAVQDRANEIDWKIPEPLPVLTEYLMESPEEDVVQEQEQNEQTDEPGTIDLRAILFSVHKPSAVVAGRIVCVGDEIDGVTIANISRDSVEFEKNGETWMQKVRK